MDIKTIQTAIEGQKVAGWLFYDFQHRDPLAYRILGLGANMHVSRRWYYYIPVSGTPIKIVSAIEPFVLDALPGVKFSFMSWQEMRNLLQEQIGKGVKIAMNYSPENHVPYVSLVDAGTIEMIRGLGIDVCSAAELIQQFEGLVQGDAFETHKIAQPIMHSIMERAFEEIGRRIRAKESCTELDIMNFFTTEYRKHHLISIGPPEVAVNAHAADPHFDPSNENWTISPGDLVLIDAWAKLPDKNAVYYDFTWMAYVGEVIPPRIQEIWEVVKGARDAAIQFEREKIFSGEPCYGWEVDAVCRKYIEDRGFGPYFLHRTGHSIFIEALRRREEDGTGCDVIHPSFFRIVNFLDAAAGNPDDAFR